jgi:hypothetical protein
MVRDGVGVQGDGDGAGPAHIARAGSGGDGCVDGAARNEGMAEGEEKAAGPVSCPVCFRHLGGPAPCVRFHDEVVLVQVIELVLKGRVHQIFLLASRASSRMIVRTNYDSWYQPQFMKSILMNPPRGTPAMS